MDTATALPQSSPVAAKPQADLADGPPWLDDAAMAPQPVTLAAPRRRPPVRAAAKAAALPQFEAVHWSVIALTLFTAFNILVGAFGGDEAKPRELLPIMMVVAR